MAIYSLRHTPIGRSTQSRPHTASAHVGYISRPQAARHVMAARMPEKPRDAANYLKQMEDGDRVNARVADKIMVALPKELTDEQRVELVRGFANDVTKGKAPWLAAIHDKGKDAANPHCHLLVRDRCPDSGKRVIGMSDAGSTDMLREKWEQHANRALERAGHDARIDRRSLQAQGIARAPTIHEGPNVRAMEKRGARPTSRMRGRRNGRGARRAMRQVNYPAIDNGQTRPEYNRALRGPETEADYWDAVDQDAQRREFEEKGLGADYRRAQKAGQRPASVHGVGRLPVQPQQGDQGSGVPLLDSPLSVSSRLPADTVGFGASPARFQPTSQGVAGREGDNEATDHFSDGPVGAKFGQERLEAGKIKEHTDSIGQNSQSHKGSDMADRDDWLGKQHADRLDQAQLQADESRGRFDDLMKRSYLDPVGAEKAMDKYRGQHGEQALYDRLNKPALGSPVGHGMQFGRRPGSILSTDGLKKGAGDRQLDSLDTRRNLADAYKRMHNDREALRAAKQTDDNFRARNAAPNQPIPAQSSEPHPGQQHKGLEQAGQPSGPAPARPEPDRSRMSPDARQAGQHRGLEQPQPSPSSPRAEPHPGEQHKGLEQAGQPKGPAPAATGPDMSKMSPEVRPAHQHKVLEQPQRPSPRPTQPSMPAASTPPVLPGPAGATAPLTRPAMAPPPGQAGGKAPVPSMAPKKRGMEM